MGIFAQLALSCLLAIIPLGILTAEMEYTKYEDAFRWALIIDVLLMFVFAIAGVWA